ncbi:uncharacterized protein METZ01_LOCUS52266 [marine metagenome]|uniref:Uncharacterized protein n=1 Tax=marine metagenome TaxID=408172 RepID=A0A381S5P3_9ZZZZ
MGFRSDTSDHPSPGAKRSEPSEEAHE